jgi:hypothetical protein
VRPGDRLVYGTSSGLPARTHNALGVWAKQPHTVTSEQPARISACQSTRVVILHLHAGPRLCQPHPCREVCSPRQQHAALGVPPNPVHRLPRPLQRLQAPPGGRLPHFDAAVHPRTGQRCAVCAESQATDGVCVPAQLQHLSSSFLISFLPHPPKEGTVVPSASCHQICLGGAPGHAVHRFCEAGAGWGGAGKEGGVGSETGATRGGGKWRRVGLAPRCWPQAVTPATPQPKWLAAWCSGNSQADQLPSAAQAA